MAKLTGPQLGGIFIGVLVLVLVIVGIVIGVKHAKNKALNANPSGPAVRPARGPAQGPAQGPTQGPASGPGQGPASGPGQGPASGPGITTGPAPPPNLPAFAITLSGAQFVSLQPGPDVYLQLGSANASAITKSAYVGQPVKVGGSVQMTFGSNQPVFYIGLTEYTVLSQTMPGSSMTYALKVSGSGMQVFSYGTAVSDLYLWSTITARTLTFTVEYNGDYILFYVNNEQLSTLKQESGLSKTYYGAWASDNANVQNVIIVNPTFTNI
jgi:hypothetical protein